MRGQSGKRARVAKSLDTRVERLRKDQTTGPQKTKKLQVKLPPPPRSGVVTLEAEGLAKSYGGPPIFTDVHVLRRPGRTAPRHGLNGAGKTSLIRVLAGESEADAGSYSLGHGVSLGYYAQEHEGITAGKAVIDHLREGNEVSDQLLRGLLGTFGLSGDIAFQDASTLSGGEKTKLALAQLSTGRHNLLLLDEADQQPSIRRHARRSARRSRRGRARSCS